MNSWFNLLFSGQKKLFDKTWTYLLGEMPHDESLDSDLTIFLEKRKYEKVGIHQIYAIKEEDDLMWQDRFHSTLGDSLQTMMRRTVIW